MPIFRGGNFYDHVSSRWIASGSSDFRSLSAFFDFVAEDVISFSLIGTTPFSSDPSRYSIFAIFFTHFPVDRRESFPLFDFRISPFLGDYQYVFHRLVQHADVVPLGFPPSWLPRYFAPLYNSPDSEYVFNENRRRLLSYQALFPSDPHDFRPGRWISRSLLENYNIEYVHLDPLPPPNSPII